MLYQRFGSAEASRTILEELAVEFWDAASDVTESLEKQRELAVIRRRAALRLVPPSKMGYEHIYWQLSQNDDFFDDEF